MDFKQFYEAHFPVDLKPYFEDWLEGSSKAATEDMEKVFERLVEQIKKLAN